MARLSAAPFTIHEDRIRTCSTSPPPTFAISHHDDIDPSSASDNESSPKLDHRAKSTSNRVSISTLPSSSDTDSDCLPTPRRPRDLRSPTRRKVPRSLPPQQRHVSASSASSIATDTDLPLVLLHISLLPLPAPWTSPTACAKLPQAVQRQLRSLCTKFTPEIVARGVLLRHPGSDLDLLKRRVVEGLGLEGQADLGDDSEEAERVDSGAELEEEKGECRGEGKWDVKVFAANGLMDAETWEVAWEEMERVDVMVTPLVGEEMTMLLEKVLDAESEANVRGQRVGEGRSHGLEAAKVEVERLEGRIRDLEDEWKDLSTTRMHQQKNRRGFEELPPAFRPEQVPIEVLLRNYIYLQAKDMRNIMILALLAVSIMLSFQVTAMRAASDFSRLDSCEVLGRTIAASLASARLLPVQTPQTTVWADTQANSLKVAEMVTVMVEAETMSTISTNNGLAAVSTTGDASVDIVGLAVASREL
ncbi:hypothetical protein K461DRAFT_297769 [Myriangium duriaei CBS 260.36]|uniref:Uncharacterized protein n=1 Tax=Myriangium duriaei CBS 260.36 TaxID=1168546 RepID=A0A9P4IQS0_9PEZI|nr:hypothetical protein K461DRAFT_297769 [Myriangium duriaei CBS 260.36]